MEELPLDNSDMPVALPARRERGIAVWFTGLSGAGKTSLCTAVARQLRRQGIAVTVLDGDELRQNVNAGLGFERSDREENVRRIRVMALAGVAEREVVLVAAISPYRAMRDAMRQSTPDFLEVYVNAPLATCIERDTKGLYRRALAGEIPSFTGVSDPYEPPLGAEVVCNTAEESVSTSAGKVLQALAPLL